MSVYDLHRIEMPQTPKGFADDSGGTHFVPAPCQVACPVGTDAPSYIALIWEEKYAEAFEAITATNPFSSICGRVCDAPCEPACRRTDSDGPLQIRNLKRFVMDKVGHRYDPPPVAVTKKESVGIVGSGPAGLTAAHDLCVAGYTVHVYEMSDRLGGMMAWAYRRSGCRRGSSTRTSTASPASARGSTSISTPSWESRSTSRSSRRGTTPCCWRSAPGGASRWRSRGKSTRWWSNGVGFLRRVNTGERPQLPEKVVVVGGGDVAMDACRVARRLPGCEHVTVIYRRGPEEIPARRIELEGAVAEGIEFVYNTQQVSVAGDGEGLRLRCVKTEAGEPDESGRRSPVAVPGSEHEIECGMVIAAVGQKGVCAELDRIGMMLPDRVRTRWETMRTDDPRVFAAGDGAFGGSTIVMAMHHGQRAAYYIEQFLEGNGDPMPYRTPYRTRRVDVAQDMMWERVKLQHPEFFGLGAVPVEFPEIEATYDDDTARKEAARCYRCDAETGTPDYSVQHREDLFSMARIGPDEHDKRRAMLQRRLAPRDNPFPEERPAQLDDIVFLPANLSRLVIDPYREACRVDFDLGGRLALAHPFLVTGFDASPREVRAAVARGLSAAQGIYLGARKLPGEAGVPWIQLLVGGGDGADAGAAGFVQPFAADRPLPHLERVADSQLLGLAVSSPGDLEPALAHALERGLDLLLLDGTGGIAGSGWPELRAAPDLGLLRDAVAILRRHDREEEVDLVWFGGVRSGTDAAKLVGLGAVAMVLGVAAGIAAGGRIAGESLVFEAGLGSAERAEAVANLIRANTGEASMMARCTGKTDLHNIEPEDLRALTLATAESAGLPLAGTKESG